MPTERCPAPASAGAGRGAGRALALAGGLAAVLLGCRTAARREGALVLSRPGGPAWAWPSLEFRRDPAGLGDKVVALTFDDGPDGAALAGDSPDGRSHTGHVLDALSAQGLRATFFICSQLHSDLARDLGAQSDLRRIVAEGHTLGNHTAHHRRVGPETPPAEVAAELAQVQAAVDRVLGTAAPRMSLYRMPFGVPFQGAAGGEGPHVAAVARLAGGAELPGVHVGWGIDTRDWDCAQRGLGPACVLANLEPFVRAGSSGVVLMHSVTRLSGDAVPQVVARLRRAGYRFTDVERMVEARYGVGSRALAERQRAQPAAAQARVDAAIAALRASEWVRGINPY